MLSRGLNLFALLGLLASQLAAMPHAHVGMTPAEQQEHAAKPHFHTGKHRHAHGHTHSHSHNHSHGGHSHRHDTPAEKSTDQGSHEPCHDDVAVYCEASTDFVLVTKTVAFAVNQFAGQFVVLTEVEFAEPDLISRHWHPPNTGQDGTELFLALRNLRL